MSKSFSVSTRQLSFAAGIIVSAAVTAWLLLGGRGSVHTDNAYIKASKVSLATEVGGVIAEVTVRANQSVKSGQLLLRLDNTPFQLAVDEAEAHLNQVKNQLLSRRADYAEAEAALEQARRDAAFYQRQLQRNEKMGPLAISEVQLDEAKQALSRARAQIAINQQKLSSLAAALGGDNTTPLEQQADLQVAQAQLDKALYQLSRTEIYAPIDGVIANETPQVGEMVPAGLTLISMISSTDTWVEANLKETQLAEVQAGQAATVVIDAYPGVEWTAIVESLSPASGSEFALIPAQNASGNWVKVVQRVPVRLQLLNKQGPDDGPVLRAGMSAAVRIDVRGSQQEMPTAKLATVFPAK
ncbi:HlyD family secretion protein [Parahaliea sp. F7430]|uniref:HlyD family secretion protein n=1 Tax=Sediminihaliea albiluteola TaxID=2758564 RepID=A0A7W2TWU9_9GAMM|nr:HlyD family secretion protein [Sediminihaliea albiluteola]MBA6413410.1 HlyD family secretion protein [Sediminihaliea albiluteola]